MSGDRGLLLPYTFVLWSRETLPLPVLKLITFYLLIGFYSSRFGDFHCQFYWSKLG
jgi:hypothetical protein